MYNSFFHGNRNLSKQVAQLKHGAISTWLFNKTASVKKVRLVSYYFDSPPKG